MLAAPAALAVPAAIGVGQEATVPSADEASANIAVVVRVDSIIQPVVVEFLVEAIAEADRLHAAALVIELNTPGGLLTSTREIFGAMIEAKTPVVVYVSPGGAQAASAGFFLLMAADVAAMAPGTNTGAAHPVGGQGEDIEGNLGEKVEQDAAASIRSLAARNHRDQALAESAVVESRSFSADEALELGLVDLLAPSLDQLLAALDGYQLRDPDSPQLVLQTRGARIERLEMTPFQRARSALAHPNIAVMFMTLGGIGLFFELTHPGAIFPGVIGAILLILGLYATSVLAVNYAGLALLGLAALLFFAEIKIQSFGLLTLGGVASLVLGAMMLFDDADPALRVSLRLIGALAVLSVVIVGSLSALVLRAQRSVVTTGSQGLLHRQARARSAIVPELGAGQVDLHGEIWNAVATEPVAAGDAVEVTRVDGLTLHVRPIAVGPPTV